MKSFTCLLTVKRLCLRFSPNSGHSSTEEAIENINRAASDQNHPGRCRKIQGDPTFLFVTKQQMMGMPACLILSENAFKFTWLESVGRPSETITITGRNPLF